MSIPQKCKIDGCTQNFARLKLGMCGKHYQSFSKYGDAMHTDNKRKNRVTSCSIDGCTGSGQKDSHGEYRQYIRGFCAKHYDRWISKGYTDLDFELHGMRYHELYNTWLNMKQRCSNEKSASYSHYGGRGIKVCERWEKSFASFLEDMGERPTKEHSIDRIDTNGDYTPKNCRWADKKTQTLNRRIMFKYGVGVRKTKSGRFCARVRRDKVEFHVGTYDTMEEAVQARKEFIASL